MLLYILDILDVTYIIYIMIQQNTLYQIIFISLYQICTWKVHFFLDAFHCNMKCIIWNYGIVNVTS